MAGEKELDSESTLPVQEKSENKFIRTIKTYVLRAGRMTDSEKRNYVELGKLYCVPFSDAPLDFEKIFVNKNPVTVEIGFGMGQATSIIAQNNPSMNYLGLEVHVPGVGRLLGEISRNNISNLRIVEYDALEVLEKMLPDNSVSGFHIFFPDPWPKKKHHKRRLVQRPNTDLLVKKLIPGGYIYMATDWDDYAETAMENLLSTPGIKNKYEGFAPHQEWRPLTKFEQKGINAGHAIHELFFVKQ